MTHHIIIGGGPAATNAAETIRQFDRGESRITLVSDEPAHSRMALPYWLAGSIPRAHAHTGDDSYFQTLDVDARIGSRVASLDAQANSIALDNGTTLPFDNLLIATGASPLIPTIPGTDLPGVHPLWSLAHTQSVLDAAAGIERPRVVMVGAGFVGFIVLNAMFKRGWQLSVVERESQVLPRMLDPRSAELVERWLASKQVTVHTQTTVEAIRQGSKDAKIIELAGGETIEADIVIIATGVKPNIELAAAAGLATDQGILIDECMQTNVPGIYAGGDAAQGPALFAEGKQVHAIQPTAVDHGRVAGANMAGHEVRYPGSLLMNVVDVCGLQCASFGNWNAPEAEPTTIDSPHGYVYRKLLWTGDQMAGAIFVGRANDMGMLTDVGMVKGILQTQTPLGPWKDFLCESPFDIRRAYVGAGIARKLAGATLLGRPTRARRHQFGGVKAVVPENPALAVYVETKAS
ncbi:MAG: NAD(P)/FAD-dependent oxidoreductase [Planctomycetes bacterium]|nr:NAD(P)/FAD-dependent oxidoreductase [Planctomycetota bacterium]MBL7037197.1 NAD(P)/FAD-dependent oxidoreductase [Pirellulaceae bacterium]